MKHLKIVTVMAAVISLTACDSSGNLTPQAAKTFIIACKTDQSIQPIAATTLASIVPQATPVVAIDNLLVHPAIVSLCDKLGGIPVAIPTTTSITTTAPITKAP